jgi:prepilin-type N-terminal cleavage/methylation domain-containing protein
MPRRTTHRSTKTSGFTIVELLIVVVVIAILAAITIVAYNGIQRRASESAAASAASQAKKKIGVWQVENANQAPDQATFNSLVGNASGLEYTPGASGAYCITSTSGTVSYMITESANATSGGCQGHAQRGVPAITNFHVNPGAVTSTGYGHWAGDSGSASTGGPVAAGWAQSGSAYRIAWGLLNGSVKIED